MAEDFTVILNFFNAIKGESMLIALFFVSLLYICVSLDDKKIQKYLVLYAIISIACFFCPFIAHAYIKYVDANTYWRVFWLVPVALITAYAAVLMILKLDGKAKKILCTVAIIGIIALCGKWVYTSENFQKTLNLYKLPPEVIQLSQSMLAEENNALIVVPAEITPYFNQYTAQIQQVYLRNGVRNYNDENYNLIYDIMTGNDENVISESLPEFKEALKNSSVDFLVLREDMPIYPYMGNLNAQYIGDYGVYELYKLEN